MRKGKKYEKAAHEVVQRLNSTKKALHDVKIVGKLSEVNRQIDIKLEESEYDFVVYECKDWKKSIDVGVVGKLLSDLEDVGAKKGAVISNSAFTKGAQNLAKKKGVDLLHLVKTDSKVPRVGISATVLAKLKYISKIQFGVQDRSFNAPLLSMDPDQFIIIWQQEPMTLRNFIHKRWNEDLGSGSRAGWNNLVIEPANIIDIKGNKYTVSRVEINYLIDYELSEGKWNIEEARGLYNVLDGTFQTYGDMKSAILSVDDIEKSFRPISTEDASKKSYTMQVVGMAGY